MTMAEGDLAVTEIAFARRANIAPRPPPAAMAGALGWLRANLLSTPFNIALTIIIALLFAWVIPELVKFLLIDAVWSGNDRDACLEIRAASRNWCLLAICLGTAALLHLRLLSDFRALASRCFLRDVGDWDCLAVVAERARRDLGAIYFFVILPSRRSSC